MHTGLHSCRWFSLCPPYFLMHNQKISSRTIQRQRFSSVAPEVVNLCGGKVAENATTHSPATGRLLFHTATTSRVTPELRGTEEPSKGFQSFPQYLVGIFLVLSWFGLSWMWHEIKCEFCISYAISLCFSTLCFITFLCQ